MASFEGIKRVGVIGAGTMGRGIVMNFVNAGYPVTWLDVNAEMLEKGLVDIASVYKRSVAQERFDDAEAQARIARITTTQAYADLAEMDLVVEAVYENMDLKKKIFAELDSAVQASAILATNTSYLDIDEIASATKRPTQVLGLHFFSPAHIMKLVEVIRAEQTDSKVLEQAIDYVTSIQKRFIIASDAPGFIVNRVARHFYVEGLKILEENVASHDVIDDLIRSLGFKMGPFELMDLIGVETNLSVTESMYQLFNYDQKFRPNRIQQKKVQAGYYGRKSGQGFYTYDE